MGYYQDVDEARYGDEYHNSTRRDIEIQDQCNKMSSRYYENARAEVGATIECACCGRKVVKKTYQQKFCPPIVQGKRKQYKCKDRYNNIFNPRGKFAHLGDRY